MFRKLWAILIKHKHKHNWRTVGYGGAGWYLIRCDECGAEEIA